MATSNLQAELRELREQMNDLKDTLSREAGRGGRNLRHRASEAYDDAARTARAATGYTGEDVRHGAAAALDGAARTAHVVADYAREGADTVAGVVRRNPGATSVGLITLGIVGGLIGYMLASNTPPARHNRWNWN